MMLTQEQLMKLFRRKEVERIPSPPNLSVFWAIVDFGVNLCMAASIAICLYIAFFA